MKLNDSNPTEFASVCKGDSGSPVIACDRVKHNQERCYVVGVVSHSDSKLTRNDLRKSPIRLNRTVLITKVQW
jgi:hypothetical protein